MFESVLFPAPFSPSSACTSPTATSRSTSSFATTPGKRFVIPRIATAGASVARPSNSSFISWRWVSRDREAGAFRGLPRRRRGSSGGIPPGGIPLAD